MKTVSCVLILLLVVSSGCKKERVEITERHQNGKKKIACIYSGSGESGELSRRVTYNNAGRVIEIENFVDNTKIMIRLHKNGEKRSESRYKDGRKHGKWLQWYSNGWIKTEKIFNNGKLVRDASYKRDIIEEIFYKDGELFIERQYKEGIISIEKTYRGGKLIKTKYFYPDGKLSDERGYKDNKKHGRWVYRDRNGDIRSDVFYNEGEVVITPGQTPTSTPSPKRPRA